MCLLFKVFCFNESVTNDLMINQNDLLIWKSFFNKYFTVILETLIK